jgi:hypothetical protein
MSSAFSVKAGSLEHLKLRGRCGCARGRQLGHVLQDRGALGQQRAVLQQRRRNVAQPMHLSVVATALHSLGVLVHAHRLGGQAGLNQRDVRREGRRPRRVVSLMFGVPTLPAGKPWDAGGPTS